MANHQNKPAASPEPERAPETPNAPPTPSPAPPVPQPAPPPAAASAKLAVPIVAEVRLAQPAAFGYGTRPKGFLVGTVEIDEAGENWLTFQPAEGINQREAQTALANRHMLEIG